MEIDQEEAKAALEDAKAYATRMKKSLNAFGAAYHFIVWGAIWLIGFSLDHFGPRLPEAVRIWHWLVLQVLGNALSFSITFRGRRYVRVGPQGAIALIWILFMGFSILGAFFVHPRSYEEGSLLIVLITMLWMAVMGAIVNKILLIAAVFVAVASAAAYLLIPDAYFLIMALAGGTSLIALGVFLLARKER